MKKIILALLLLLPTLASATMRNAASCSATDVMTQVTASANGDTVLVPGGTCTWDTSSNAVTISSSHQIILNGQGITTINFAGSGTVQSGNALSVTAGAANNTFITGFHFVGSFINGGCPIGLNTGTLPFRFYNNVLNDGGPPNPGTIICVSGLGPGLIDSNTFGTTGGADELIHNLGINNSTGWTTDVVPGGLTMIFIESNTFTATNPHFNNSAVQAYNGARTVFRYNTMGLSFFVDQHAGGASSGARWWEVYGNSFNVQGNTSYNQSTYSDMRGGSGVYWGNTSTGSAFQTSNLPGINVGPLGGSSDPQTGTWPINWQIGRGISENYSPAYFWGNPTFLNPTPAPSTNPPYVQGGPTPSSASCVANGTTGHSASVCDYVYTPTQPTTLLRCESAADVGAGCPVSYAYVPAPFPHPLRATTSTTISITPAFPNFGTVNVGASSTQTLTVTNIGTGTNTLSTPFFTFATGTQYSEVAAGSPACTNGLALTSSSTCQFGVKFTPTTQATLTDTLTVHGTTNATATLTGVGQNSASAPATPTNLVATGSGGAGAPITLTWTASTGTGPITYNCLVSPPANGVGGPYTVFITATNTTCLINPASTGVYHFEVSATNSTGTSPATAPVAFTVNSATAPSASLSPLSFAFPVTTLGGASGPFPITLTNVGTANLVVSSVTIPTFTDFSVTTSPSPCGTLAPAATCTLSVTFTPSATGTQTASLNVASNDPVNPTLSATLTGTGIGGITLFPGTLSFPNEYPNRGTASQIVTLTNNTNVTITISSAALTTGTQYSLSNACGGTLASNASCNITVTFAPTSTGTKTDTLTVIYTGAGGGTLTTTMTGSGNTHKVKKGVTM